MTYDELREKAIEEFKKVAEEQIKKLIYEGLTEDEIDELFLGLTDKARFRRYKREQLEEEEALAEAQRMVEEADNY